MKKKIKEEFWPFSQPVNIESKCLFAEANNPNILSSIPTLYLIISQRQGNTFLSREKKLNNLFNIRWHRGEELPNKFTSVYQKSLRLYLLAHNSDSVLEHNIHGETLTKSKKKRSKAIARYLLEQFHIMRYLLFQD